MANTLRNDFEKNLEKMKKDQDIIELTNNESRSIERSINSKMEKHRIEFKQNQLKSQRDASTILLSC